jgi:hypothetical protein
MPATLQQLPRDAEVLAFEAGCEDYGKREVHEVEQQGHRVYLHLGLRRDEPPRRSPAVPWPRSTPTRRRRCAGSGRRSALVEIVKVVDHEAGHGDDQVAEDGDQVPSPGR